MIKAGTLTYVEWYVTLYDLIWQVTLHSFKMNFTCKARPIRYKAFNNLNGATLLGGIGLATQAIPPCYTLCSVAWSVCLSVCLSQSTDRLLSQSCILYLNRSTNLHGIWQIHLYRIQFDTLCQMGGP